VNKETTWLIIGFLGQALFSARFLIQWLASERAKQSVIPVLIVGQGSELLIYAHNLYFIIRGKRIIQDNKA